MGTRTRLYDGDTFEHAGRTFRVTFPYDDTGECPWEQGDGNGHVSEWTTRDKRPGERVIASDRSHKRYYDYAEAMDRAKREGWDAPPYGTGTKGEQAARAVERDYEWMRAWCEDRWHYVGVVVALVDDDFEDDEETESVWGVGDDDMDHLVSVAYELADEIMARIEVDEPHVILSEN